MLCPPLYAPSLDNTYALDNLQVTFDRNLNHEIVTVSEEHFYKFNILSIWDRDVILHYTGSK